MGFRIVVTMMEEGLVHEGRVIDPATGPVVLDPKRGVRVLVAARPGNKPGQTLLQLLVRVGDKEYVVPAHIPGEYALLPEFGHRIKPVDEIKDPLERVLREEGIPLAAAHFYHDPTVAVEVWVPIGTETSMAVKPWNFAKQQTAVLNKGGKVRCGAWTELGPGLGRARDAHYSPSSKGVVVVLHDVRVGRHPGIMERRIEKILIGRATSPAELRAALLAAKQERLDIIQAVPVSAAAAQA
jgi:hypothetical protein